MKVRADLSRALALVDSREVPRDVLDAIGDAHHALTVALAHLARLERREADRRAGGYL